MPTRFMTWQRHSSHISGKSLPKSSRFLEIGQLLSKLFEFIFKEGGVMVKTLERRRRYRKVERSRRGAVFIEQKYSVPYRLGSGRQ